MKKIIAALSRLKFRKRDLFHSNNIINRALGCLCFLLIFLSVSAQSLSYQDLVNLQKSDFAKVKGFFSYNGWTWVSSKTDCEGCLLISDYALNYSMTEWSNGNEKVQYLYKTSHENVVFYYLEKSSFEALETQVNSILKLIESSSTDDRIYSLYSGGKIQITFNTKKSKSYYSSYYSYEVVILNKGDVNKIIKELCSNCHAKGVVNDFEKCSRCNGDSVENCYECKEGKLICQHCTEGYENCSSCWGNATLTCNNCSGRGYENCNSCWGRMTLTCNKCYGNGTYQCNTCYGQGTYQCNKCYGQGEVSTGVILYGQVIKVKCVKCSGKGKLTCENCFGKGKFKCEDCSGEGKIACSNCAGKGKFACDNCSETGKIKCTGCDGKGKNVCRYCNGNFATICQKCLGTMKTKDKCRRCEGSGNSGRIISVTCPVCNGTKKANK